MTRRLVAALPEYGFDGPGMVPFARDIDNFWYKLSKIVLTQASPHMYVRRFRWIGDVLGALGDAGVDIGKLTRKSLLRTCNSITIGEEDGLAYLEQFFDALFATIGVDFRAFPALAEHHDAFFESSRARIQRLQAEGAEYIGEIATFKRVFEGRKGITVSTIHGVKGAEYDTVISYALLEAWCQTLTTRLLLRAPASYFMSSAPEQEKTCICSLSAVGSGAADGESINRRPCLPIASSPMTRCHDVPHGCRLLVQPLDFETRLHLVRASSGSPGYQLDKFGKHVSE
ncbi:hypothetical protein AJ88_46750 [Mesorhizobium amorphae CCBAU 01583]|nr:hypothetical protein AJ88_46750 [Mesorhizobium amorphae CCBAU 01583]